MKFSTETGTVEDWDVEHLGDGKVVLRVTEPVGDGWLVTVELTKPRDRVTVAGVHFRPTDGEHALMSTDILKQLRLGDLHRRLTRDIRRSRVARFTLPADWYQDDIEVPRPGAKGREDYHYAVWAQRYLDALKVDERAPHAVLAERYPGRSRDWLRKQINKARAAGVLTAASATKPGGELTDYGRQLLSGNGD